MTGGRWAPVAGVVTGVAILVVLFAPSPIERFGSPTPDSRVSYDDEVESLLLHERFAEAFDLGLDRLTTAWHASSATAPETVDRLVDLGHVALRMGDHWTAQQILEAALVDARATFDRRDPRLAKALLEAGSVAQLADDHERAGARIAEGLAIVGTRADELPALAGALVQARANWLRRSDPEAALAEYRRAHELRARHPDVPFYDRVDGQVWLAWNLSRRHRTREAAELLDAAMADLRGQGLERHYLSGVCLNRMADLALLGGGRERAEALSGLGMEALADAMRRHPPGYPRFRCMPLGAKRRARSLLDRGRSEAAWAVLEREREALPGELELLARAFRDDTDTSRELRELKRRQAVVDERVRRSAPPERSAWSAAPAAFLELLALRARIAALEAASLGQREGDPVDLDVLRRTLGPDEAYLGFVEFDDAVDDGRPNPPEHAAFLVRPDRELTWIPLSVDESSYELYSQRLYVAGAWPMRVELDTETERLGHVVGDGFVGPVAPRLDGVRRVVVEISNEIPRVPIEVLPLADGTRFGDRFTVTYARSAATWVRLLRTSRPATALRARPAILVGDAEPTRDRTAAAALPSLPYASAEIAALRRLLPDAVVFGGDDPSLESLSRPGGRPVGEFGLVHIATHFVRASDSHRWALALPGDGPLSSRLLFPEQVRLGLDLDAELVTLSGCRSIVSRGISAIDTLGGFDLAFLGAGARRVVASMWPVDDHASALLMTRFYGNLIGPATAGEPMTSARALQEARSWLASYTDEEGRRPFAHPAYWAGFIHIGPDR